MKGENRKRKPSFVRAADILSRRVNEGAESEAWNSERSSASSIGLTGKVRVFDSVYNELTDFRDGLIRDFEGKPLEEVFSGRVVSNEYGESYCIDDSCSTLFKSPGYDECRSALIADLKLVCGIGSVRESRLKEEGYLTIEDLKRHSTWMESARRVLDVIDGSDLGLLQRWLWRFLPRSHPLVHYSAGLLKREDFVLLDIETLGLFGRPVIVLGVARPMGNRVCVSQYLLRDISEEPAVLWEFASNIGERDAFVSFNGRAFDVPSLQQRLNFYGMGEYLSNPHFDLLYFARRAWRNELADCRLGTLESRLGIHRELDIPSALVPGFYKAYMETGNVGPLVPVVEHNKQDLITLAALFTRLYEAWDL